MPRRLAFYCQFDCSENVEFRPIRWHRRCEVVTKKRARGRVKDLALKRDKAAAVKGGDRSTNTSGGTVQIGALAPLGTNTTTVGGTGSSKG